jgi:hypothetical protein
MQAFNSRGRKLALYTSVAVLFFGSGYFVGQFVGGDSKAGPENHIASLRDESGGHRGKQIESGRKELIPEPAPPHKVVGNKLLRIPQSILDALPSSIVFMSDGTLQIECLATYGVPPGKWRDVKQTVDKAVSQLKELEIENSELVTLQNGEQYFRMKPFPKAGNAIREDLLKSIRAQIGSDGDDRADLLCAALSNKSMIGEFGKKKAELWFEEIKGGDGPPEWRAYEKATQGHVTQTHQVMTNDSRARLAKLVEKHSPKR